MAVTPESGRRLSESSDKMALVVTQPEKFQGLLETIALLDRISETMGEDRSGDMGGAGMGGTGGTKGDQSAQSARAQAIANIPAPDVMRSNLEHYIKKEIRGMRKEVRKAATRLSKPGSAHRLNKLYSKMRRLNLLMIELAEASTDVLRRLFIRIFIDKQSVLAD